MAIDYGNYAQLYGGGVDTTALTEGINKALEKNKQARAGKISQFVDSWWDGHTKNFETAAFGDVGTWFKGTPSTDATGMTTYTPLDLGRKDPMVALLEFKKDARAKLGNAAFNEMLNAGHFSPGNFKKQYEQQIKSFVPMIERKLQTYQKLNHLSDDKIKEMVGDNKGLQRFLLDYSESADIRDLAIPDRTTGQWFRQKFGDPGGGTQAAGLAGTTARAALLGGAMYQTAMPTLRGAGRLVGYNTPNYTSAQIQKMADITKGSKAATALDKAATKNVTKAKSAVTRSQSAYNKAKNIYNKNYHKNPANKGKKPNFKASKIGKKLQTGINTAKSNLGTAKNRVGKGSLKVIQKYIKKHGTKKLIQVLGKKFGVMGALRIAAQLGVGTVASGTGIGTLAGAALNAYTLWQIADMIGDLVE